MWTTPRHLILSGMKDSGVFKSHGVSSKLVSLLKNLYRHSQLAVKVNQILGEWFSTEIDSR